MWIVRLALRRPYTFVVASLLLLLLTPFVLLRTPTDIFPAINITVVSIVWNYTGLSARDIEQRMVYGEERALTTTVNNIQHIESTSYDSVGVIKVFFQPGVSPEGAVAQITAVSQTILKQLPPGTTPPLIIEFNASNVPILQYGISSTTLSEQQTFDLAMNTIRVGLISVPGVGIPYPYGGKQRVVSVDLDPKALNAQNISQQDVVTALTTQNLVYPSGTAKIGANEYPIDLNTSLRLIEQLNNLPIKTVEGTVIRVHDVAQVRDGYIPQQNIVRVDDATVTIENVERHLRAGETLENGILAGAGEIALPAMVSTLCICIVFVPMFFLTGVARFLFAPLAESVVFAVLASYALSRTLVPTLVMWFERNVNHQEHTNAARVPSWVRPLVMFQQGFERAFDRFRQAYHQLLGVILDRRLLF